MRLACPVLPGGHLHITEVHPELRAEGKEGDRSVHIGVDVCVFMLAEMQEFTVLGTAAGRTSHCEQETRWPLMGGLEQCCESEPPPRLESDGLVNQRAWR